jgi:starch synthase
MNRPLRILMVASEMVPFAKTGGLADMIGSLSARLSQRGHDVRVVMPCYGWIDRAAFGAETALATMGVPMGGGATEWCTVWRTRTGSGVTVYLIEHKLFFDRWGLYHGPAMDDYHDNPRRFGFLCRAALQLCIDIDFWPQIVHGNDWQTALAPAYCATVLRDHPRLRNTATVLTIHNVSYQGVYPKSCWEYLGLGWEHFTPDKFEAYDQVSLLKGGIHFADMVTTVSPTHAREIAAPNGGFGLAPAIAAKGGAFAGILNGVDYSVWSPETDTIIPANYSSVRMHGKRICKRALQERFFLTPDGALPVIGMIGRFAAQKGFDLIAQTIDSILDHVQVQIAVLGTGEHELEHFFGILPARRPGFAGSYIGFSNELSHLIEAGSDFFLMPSRFEPCGLNQMYSLRYGTLPIVHVTGGLADTVVDYKETDGSGTGFLFHAPEPQALYDAVMRAISTYYDRPLHMHKMVQAAMDRDFSWDISCRAYEEVYERALHFAHSRGRSRHSPVRKRPAPTPTASVTIPIFQQKKDTMKSKPIVCIKIGGATIDTPGLLSELAESIKAIMDSAVPVLVHGGGKDIGRQLDLLKKQFTFVEGMRVTDAETMKHVQMVLSGDVNKRIVNVLLSHGVPALGLSGVDMNLMTAAKMTIKGQDIGFVGDVEKVDPRIIEICRDNGIVPVISPVSRGSRGEFYNVNADPAASEIAIALAADHLVYISDVPGVLVEKQVHRELRTADVEGLIAQGHVTGGMIPKLRSAADAVGRGVKRLHICGWHGAPTIGDELAIETASGTVVY